MITIKLCGGLGNQLFQYAFGYQLAKKLDTGIILDVSWFDKQKLRNPEILMFNIRYDSVEKTWEKRPIIRSINTRVINRGIRILGLEKLYLGGYHYLKETRYQFKDSVAKYSTDGSYLDGYWQCPLYFDDVKSDLIDMFQTRDLSPGVAMVGEQLKEQDSLAIHVRRGDYPSKKRATSRLATISEEYYCQAIDYMASIIGSNRKVYVFSNDIGEALKMIEPLLPCRVSSLAIKTTAIDEWYLMKCCKNLIIGNSTFSWWAAYLNEYKNKIICTPGYYWGNDDIIPPGWIKF